MLKVEKMLKVEQVRYRYRNESFSFDFEVKEGSITAIMGPSGAGKSTLLSLVAGFIQPENGDILVNGGSCLNKEPHQRPFSVLFQEHNLFSHLTVKENIGLGLHPGLKLDREQWQSVAEAARQVGIEEYLDRIPQQLSGGQRQRVALARCFIQPHPIWLLDEPFSALDPLLREEMLSLVKMLATERRATVLMVTHHISDARAIASDFLFVEKGKGSVPEPVEALQVYHQNPKIAAFVQAGSQ